MIDPKTLKVGDHCNWQHQAERLVYMGMCEPRLGRWHQFHKVGEPTVVWCEVLTSDLQHMELTKPEFKRPEDTEGGACD